MLGIPTQCHTFVIYEDALFYTEKFAKLRLLLLCFHGQQYSKSSCELLQACEGIIGSSTYVQVQTVLL